MHSSSPAGAPKSQLDVEQASTGKYWNPLKKDMPHPRTKEKPQQSGRRGMIMIKSNPTPGRGWPTDRRTVMPKKLSHCWEGSGPHIRLPSLGIWPRDWESPGNLTLKATGVGVGGGGQRILEGTSKILCASRPRGEEQWAHRRLSQTYLWVFGHLLQRHGLAVAHHKERGPGSSNPGRCVSTEVLLEVNNSPTIESVDSSTRWPQAQQEASAAPVISR